MVQNLQYENTKNISSSINKQRTIKKWLEGSLFEGLLIVKREIIGEKNEKEAMPMDFRYGYYLGIQLLSLFILSSLAWYTWRNRHIKGAFYFCLTLFLTIFWLFFQILEFAAVELATKLLFANFQYLPITLAPLFYLSMTLALTGHSSYLNKTRFKALYLFPAIVNLFIWTDSWHGLIRQNVYLDTGGLFPLVGKTMGPTLWFFGAANLFICLLSLAFLALAPVTRRSIQRSQFAILIIGLFFPMGTTALHLLQIIPLGFDLTPVIFGLSGSIVVYGIFRYRLLDVVPVARSTVIEAMKTAIIVLDERDRIVDLNPAAADFFNFSPIDIVGKEASHIFNQYPDLLHFYHDNRGIHRKEIIVESKETDKNFDISLINLSDESGEELGRVILAHNITARKRLEDFIRSKNSYDLSAGLYTRDYLKEELQQLDTHFHLPLSIIMVSFHGSNNRILKKVSAILRISIEENSILGHWDDEHLIIILPQTHSMKAYEVCYRILENSQHSMVGGKPLSLSIGLGYREDLTKEIEDVLREAYAPLFHTLKEGMSKNESAMIEREGI